METNRIPSNRFHSGYEKFKHLCTMLESSPPFWALGLRTARRPCVRLRSKSTHRCQCIYNKVFLSTNRAASRKKQAQPLSKWRLKMVLHVLSQRDVGTVVRFSNVTRRRGQRYGGRNRRTGILSETSKF